MRFLQPIAEGGPPLPLLPASPTTRFPVGLGGKPDLTRHELAELLGVSYGTVKTLQERGKLVAIPPSGTARSRFSWSDLRETLLAAIKSGGVVSAREARRETLQTKRAKAASLAADTLEREEINKALEQTKGNRTEAARLLKTSRQNLHTKLRRWPDLVARNPAVAVPASV